LTHSSLHESWVAQAQADAERDILECRMCRRKGPLDDALTIWRNGTIVFGVCDGCCASHDVLLRTAERGLEVRGISRRPLIVGGR
jgi:hypothetical protein